MKKLSSIVLFLFCTTLFAQKQHVNFHVNEEGEYIRTDSDKNYYVFNYGTNLDAEGLQEMFYNKWKILQELPPYFDSPLEDSFYSFLNKDTGEIGGTTPFYRGRIDNVSFKYSFELHFRDGRARIDPPSVSVRNGNTGLLGDIPILDWINSYSSFPSKEVSNAKKDFAEGIPNAIINTYLSFIEGDNMFAWMDDWSNPQELKSQQTTDFKLNEEAVFRFPNDSFYQIYRIAGITKQQLKESFSKIMGYICLQNKDKIYDSVSWNDTFYDGCYITGTQDTYLRGFIGGAKFKCSISYKSYIDFNDEMIKVYVPKITGATVHYYNKDDNYTSFKQFLDSFHVYKKDGSFSEKRQDTIDEINKTLNLVSFAPIYLIKDYIDKMNEPEEEW